MVKLEVMNQENKYNAPPIEDLIKSNRQLRESIQERLKQTRGKLYERKSWPLFYLATHVLRLHEALELLIERGFGREAGILLRSMFEAAVNIAWISKDVESRLERFASHQYFAAQKYRELKEKKLDIEKLSPAEREEWEKEGELIRSEAKKGRHKYGFRPNLNWSGKSTRQMAEEVGWIERYDRLYKVYSEVTHSGVVGAHDFITQHSSGALLIDNLPKFPHSVICLQEAYFYVTLSLGLADAYIGLGINEIIDKAMVDIKQVRPDAQI